MPKIYGQSTKESYRDDIETSRKQKTVFKIFEWLDDYSYSNSKNLGIYLEKKIDDNEEITNLYLFQEDGPKQKEILSKFIEWRRSGESNEIGHKGGGNKRNIYGYDCEEVHLFMRLNNNQVLRSGTKPNALYKLSISDIDEHNFRAQSDSSTYITNPEIKKIKDLPGWYNSNYTKIKQESNIEPNFIIKFILQETPDEFLDESKWNEFINQIRAKQYKIPIHFKNELIGMDTYEKYNNLDLLGIDDSNKICEKDINLYLKLDNMNTSFYLEEDNQYFNVANINDSLNSNQTLKKWGTIKLFITNKDYFHKYLKEYNTNNPNSLTAEHFYGIYLL